MNDVVSEDTRVTVRKGTKGQPFTVDLAEKYGEKPRFGTAGGGTELYDRQDGVFLTRVGIN